jgi:hypothetical protein
MFGIYKMNVKFRYIFICFFYMYFIYVPQQLFSVTIGKINAAYKVQRKYTKI